MQRKKRSLVVFLLIFLPGVTFAAWCLGILQAGEDAEVAAIRAQMKSAFDQGKQSDEERREARKSIRKKVGQLTDEQKAELRRSQRGAMENYMNQRIDAYFELPPEERVAYLDEEIDRMEEFRKRMKEARPKREAAGEDSGRGRRGGGNGQSRRERWRNATPEQKNEWRARFLDRSTPEQRAKFSEYFADLRQRRQERGLPELRGPFR